MQDTILNGSGTSRSLKIPASKAVIYQDISAMVQDMVDGNFLFDIGPIRLSGVTQKGTDLNKANLLSDETAAAYGLEEDATPTDAFLETGKIGDLVRTARSEVVSDLFTRYMPASGQILKASDYPKLAAAIGPAPAGYKATRTRTIEDEPSLPKGIRFLTQGENGRLIFYSFSPYQILGSDDNLETFQTLLGLATAPLGIFKSVSVPNKIIVLMTNKTYTSTDNGVTWEEHVNNITIPDIPWYRQYQDGTILAINAGNIYRSTDDGNSWEKIATGTGSMYINEGTILRNGYLIGWNTSGSNPYLNVTFYGSKDGGETWEILLSTAVGTSASISIHEFEEQNVVTIITNKSVAVFKNDFTSAPTVNALDFSVMVTYSGISGPKSIYMYGHISNDYGYSWTPSEISAAYGASVALLPDGTVILISPGTTGYIWTYSSPDPTTILVPDAHDMFIKYQ